MPTTRTARFIANLFLSTLIIAAVSLTGAAVAKAKRPPVGRPVSLSQARTAPDFIASVRSHTVVTVDGQCRRGYFTDTSAYWSNGDALAGQRWTFDRALTYWKAPRGYVTFDGVTFRNLTPYRVLIAGWCG